MLPCGVQGLVQRHPQPGGGDPGQAHAVSRAVLGEEGRDGGLQ